MYRTLVTAAATAFRAVFHLSPTGSPLFAPSKRTLADQTSFARELEFLMGHGTFSTLEHEQIT